MKKIIFILILHIILINTLFAQISLKTGVNRSTFNIGDLIVYTISLTYEKDLQIILPPPGKELGQFDIKDYNISDRETKEKNKKIKTIEYSITTYFLGEFEIPSIQIQYKDKKNNSGIIQTEPLLVKVIPVKRLPTDKDDIRDLKSPLYVKTYIWLYILIGIILLAICGGAYWYYKKYIKKEIKVIPEEKVAIQPEDIEALQAIKELQKKDYIRKNQIKEYFFELSEIIRKYLSRRYKIRTLERTSFEIMTDMKKILNNKDLLKSFDQFFQLSDLVKFAKYKASANQIKGGTQVAINLINKTKRKYSSDEIL
ncbi:MAG: BatD family protein [Spirochaetes bacterium]|nr:BatD family protein [Spirochaetota bacterium]